MKKVLAAALLLLPALRTADSVAQARAAEAARPPESATATHGGFAQTLLDIAGLEKDTRYDEAIALCDRARAEFPEAAQQAILARTAARLARGRTQANELSFALRSLADGKEHTLEEAREKLKSAGEIGRTFLRKAVREGNEAAFREAGAVLIEMGDKTIPDIFVERWRHHHSSTMAPLILAFLERSKTDLDYGHVARLCESASAQPAVLSVVLDALEASVTMLPSTTGKKGEEPPLPQLGQLSARMNAALQPVVAKALFAYVEKRRDPKPDERLTVERAEKVLVEGGFATVPGLLARAMARHRTGPAGRSVLGLLKRLPDRSLDDDALRELVAHAAADANNEPLAADVVLDWLEAVAGLPPPPARKESEVATALGKLPARVRMDLQPSIANLLVGFVEKRAGAQELPAEEESVVERAERMLVLGRFPQVPALLVSRIGASTSAPVRVRLAGMLQKMPDSLDSASLKHLIAFTVRKGNAYGVLVDLVMDVLECMAAVGPGDRRSSKKAPFKFAMLPSRLDDETGRAAVAMLIDFIETHATGKPEEEEKKTLERAEKILIESTFLQVPRLLVERLKSNARQAVPEGHGRLLRQMAGRLDKEALRGLAACVVEGNVNRCMAARVFMDWLEWSTVVLRSDGFPERGRPPALETLPTRLDDNMHDLVLKTLVAFIEIQVAAEMPEPERKELERAERILVQSGFRKTPTVLLAKLTQTASWPFRERLVGVLAQMREPLAKMEHHHRSALVNALVAILERPVQPDAKPGWKAAVDQAERILAEGWLPEAPVQLVQRLKSGPAKPVAGRLVALIERRRQDVDGMDANNRKVLAEGLIAFLQSRVADKEDGERKQDIERVGRMLTELKYDHDYMLFTDRLTARPAPSAEFAEELVELLEPLRGSLARLDANRRANLLRALIAFVEKRAVQNPTKEQREKIERAERILVESRLPEAPGLLVASMRTFSSGAAADRLVRLLDRMKNGLTKLDDNSQTQLIRGLLKVMETGSAQNATAEQKEAADRAEKLLVELKLGRTLSLLIQSFRRATGPFAERLARTVKGFRDQVDERTFKQFKSLASKEGPNKALLEGIVNHLAPKFPDKK